jgi:hypothetical protein
MTTLKEPEIRHHRRQALTKSQLNKATNDRLEQYLSSLEALRAEKAELEARLARIEQALSGVSATRGRASIGGGQGRGRRSRNSLSLRDAVAQATRNRPLTKAEILQAIEKIGYRFSTKDPMNSLNAMLYAPGNKFRRQNGRFSPK